MAQFTVNPQRFDPYKNFKFRVKWDGKYVAGISRVSALKRTTEVIEHREGGDPSANRKSPGITKYEAITLERGVTILDGTGAYTGQSRPVLYCVITRAEVARIKDIVKQADPKAFMVIGMAHEALGEGFRPLQ